MKPGDYIRITSCHPAFSGAGAIGFVETTHNAMVGDGRVAMVVYFGPATDTATCLVYSNEAELVTDGIEIAAAKLVYGI